MKTRKHRGGERHNALKRLSGTRKLNVRNEENYVPYTFGNIRSASIGIAGPRVNTAKHIIPKTIQPFNPPGHRETITVKRNASPARKTMPLQPPVRVEEMPKEYLNAVVRQTRGVFASRRRHRR